MNEIVRFTHDERIHFQKGIYSGAERGMTFHKKSRRERYVVHDDVAQREGFEPSNGF